jgi:uncharacterized protein (TIGR02001 family)
MRNMKKLIGVALAAGATVMSAGAANAEVSGSVALVSDYVFRGISQSEGGPAIQGSLDWTNDIFYAGAWGSSTDLGVGEAMELDLYVGVTPTTGPIEWDLAVVGYFYPNADDDGAEADYFEGIAAASFNVTEQFSVGGQVAFTPEYFGDGGEGIYYEANAGYAISDAFSLSAGYGVQDIDFAPDSYSTWYVGGAYAIHGFTLGATYSDTEDAFDNGYVLDESNADGRFVLSIGREL